MVDQLLFKTNQTREADERFQNKFIDDQNATIQLKLVISATIIPL